MSNHVENFSQKAIYIVMKIRYNEYIDTVRNKIKENFYTTSKPDSVGLLLCKQKTAEILPSAVNFMYSFQGRQFCDWQPSVVL